MDEQLSYAMEAMMSGDTEKIGEFFEAVRGMPVEEAARTLSNTITKAEAFARTTNPYSLYTREEHLIVEIIEGGLNAMGDVIKTRRGEKGHPLNLTSEEMAAMVNLFESFQEIFRPFIYLLYYQVPHLINFLIGNPELVEMSTTLIGDLLSYLDVEFYINEPLDLIRQCLKFAGNTFSLKEAASVLTRFNRENPSALKLTSETFDAIKTALNRRKAEIGEGQQFNLNDEEQKALSDLFRSFEKKLSSDSVSIELVREMIYALNSLLQEHPELKTIVSPLLNKLTSTYFELIRITN